MFCCTAWTGRDRGVRLRQCVDNGDVPCQCFASVPGYQCAGVGASAVDSDQADGSFTDKTVALHRARQTRSLISW